MTQEKFVTRPSRQNQPILDIGDRGEEEQEQRDMDLRLEIEMSPQVMLLIHKPVVGKTAAMA